MIEPLFEGTYPTEKQVKQMEPDANPEHPRAAMVLKALGGGGNKHAAQPHQHYVTAKEAGVLKGESKEEMVLWEGKDDQLDDTRETAWVGKELTQCWCSANFDHGDLAAQNALSPYRRWYTRNDLLLVAPG